MATHAHKPLGGLYPPGPYSTVDPAIFGEHDVGPPPAAPTFVVSAADPPTRLPLKFGNGTAKLSEGWGGWEVQERWKRQAITYWKGAAPYKQTVPVLIDGPGADTKLRRLRRLGRPDPDTGEDPPVVKLAGAGLHRTDLKWVINVIEEGDAVRDDDMTLLEQPLTLTLLQFVDAESVVLAGGTSASRNRQKSKKSGGRRSPSDRAAPNAHVAAAGETLSTVAAHVYGDESRWRAIAAANGIRDPRSLVPGQRLILP